MSTRFFDFCVVLVSLIGAFVLGLTIQAAHGQKWDKSVGFDVSHYRFEITLSDVSNEIEGLAAIDIGLDSPKIADVHFDLSDSMAVDSVTVDGRSAEFAHDGNRLTIELPTSRGRAHRISIAYSGVPADGLIIGSNKHGERRLGSVRGGGYVVIPTITERGNSIESGAISSGHNNLWQNLTVLTQDTGP